MPIRPASVPLFGTAAPGGALVEPVELVRQNGFGAADRPPAQWFNWLFNSYGAWLDFLRGPNTSNWQSHAPGVTFSRAAVDVHTVETTVPVHRILAVASSGDALYKSARGQAWSKLSPIATAGAMTSLCAVAFTGARWVVAASNGKLYRAAAENIGGSPIADDTALWVTATLPGGVTAISAGPNAIGVPDPLDPLGTLVVVAAGSKILVSTTGGDSYVAATLSAALSGGDVFTAVLWDGVAWVAFSAAGAVYRTTSATSTWTAVTTSIPVPTGGAYVLATDGVSIVAVPYLATAGTAWWVSTDHGQTWASQAAPTGLGSVRAIRYLDGQWMLSMDIPPYVAAANATDADSWVRLTLPIYSDSNAILDLLYAEGSILALVNNGRVLVSQRALDLSPGPWAPVPGPALLHDAAYLRGRLVASTAPTNSQTLLWNAATSQWEPGDQTFASGSVGSLHVGTSPQGGSLLYNGGGNALVLVSDASSAFGVPSVGVAVASGAGLAADATHPGTASGAATITTGTGGTGSATEPGGAAGDILIQPGDAGNDAGGGGHAGAKVTINGGNPSGANTAGLIELGQSHTSAVKLGKTSGGPTVELDVGADSTGDMLYRDSGGHLARLALGSSPAMVGQVVRSAGNGNVPTIGWPNILAGTTLTATGPITSAMPYVRLDSGAAAFSAFLPAANTVPDGWTVEVKDVAGHCGTTAVAITPAGSDTIDGVNAALSLNTNWGFYKLRSNGANGWEIVGKI